MRPDLRREAHAAVMGDDTWLMDGGRHALAAPQVKMIWPPAANA
jgi:hypothetical protein